MVEQETNGVGDRTRGWKSGWRRHKRKPEAEGDPQGRKRRGAREGRTPLSRFRIAVHNICKGAAILKGEASGLTVSSEDCDFIQGLEVQGPFSTK